MATRTQKQDGSWIGRVRIAVWGGAAALLALPLVAMQFTREVQWDETDFIVAGVMLGAACGAFEVAVRMSRRPAYVIGFGLSIVGVFLLVWFNLAVGIIGSEDNPANALFGGVLTVGAVGAAAARLQARGMARAMLATAAAQALVAAVVLIGGMDAPLLLLAMFVALWLASAALFDAASRG